MLIHVVLFNFKAEVTESKRKEVLDIARKVLPEIPGVTNLMAGKKIRDMDEFEYAISMNFLDTAALEEYRQHPDHVKFRDIDFFPYVETKQGIDYED